MWSTQLGITSQQSGIYESIFKGIAQSETGSFRSLKPLTALHDGFVRMVAMQAVIEEYDKVLISLEEKAASILV